VSEDGVFIDYTTGETIYDYDDVRETRGRRARHRDRAVDAGQTFADAARVHDDGWVIDACPHAGPALAVARARGLVYGR
jgi:hypothetical protein